MKKVLNSLHLKIITLALMIGGWYLQNIIYFQNEELLISGGALPPAQNALYSIGYVLYLASFPLAAFLLVEGAKKTADMKKMWLRLFACAVVAEIPMDIANYGLAGVKQWGGHQNYYFTLLLGLSVILLMEQIKKKFRADSMQSSLLTILAFLAGSILAVFLRAEQGSVGIMIIVALYLFYGNRMFSLITVAALYIFNMGSVNGLEYIPAFSILITWLYDGKPGKKGKVLRYLIYAAFPVAYCVLGFAVRGM